MSDFKYNEKETYTNDDIKAILDQHYKYAEKSIKSDFENKLSEKDKLVSEIQAKTIQEKQQALINTIPEKNRDLANAYIKASGKNIDEAWQELSSNHKELFQENNIMGLAQAMQLEKQTQLLQENNEKIKNIEKNGAKTPEDMELYAQHLESILK